MVEWIDAESQIQASETSATKVEAIDGAGEGAGQSESPAPADAGVCQDASAASKLV
jgi:hypothetical protein